MCEFYGSNNSNDYNDIMDYPVASNTLIFLGQTLLSSSTSGYFIINNTTPFLYFVINVHVNQTGFINSSFCSGSGNNQGFIFLVSHIMKKYWNVELILQSVQTIWQVIQK